MKWQDILKLDDYVETKISDLKEQIKRAKPEDIKLLEEQLAYWESIRDE
jgi:hypothetical protein|tara:strand:- start:559 stop:705 length:147 start_codon:yes stop_codon:yes gene_type:complete